MYTSKTKYIEQRILWICAIPHLPSQSASLPFYSLWWLCQPKEKHVTKQTPWGEKDQCLKNSLSTDGNRWQMFNLEPVHSLSLNNHTNIPDWSGFGKNIRLWRTPAAAEMREEILHLVSAHECWLTVWQLCSAVYLQSWG